jgi:hypothetical protein
LETGEEQKCDFALRADSDSRYFIADLGKPGAGGRGRFNHSPHSGTHVRVERLSGYYRRAFAGAVRPAWHRLPRIPTHL